MGSRWVSVGGAVVLAVVAVLATLFAGVLLMGGVAPRSSASDADQPETLNTQAE
jgi:predicted esterase